MNKCKLLFFTIGSLILIVVLILIVLDITNVITVMWSHLTIIVSILSAVGISLVSLSVKVKRIIDNRNDPINPSI